MAERPGLTASPTSHSAAAEDADDRLADMLRRSRLALIWERVWPCLWMPLSVILVFLTSAWIGFWLPLPPVLRMAGMAMVALLLVASFAPLLRLKWPTDADALARLDRTAAAGHRPASAVRDTLALGESDPFTQALWKTHLARQQRDLAGLVVQAPAPGMVRIDRLALRAAPVVAAVAAFFVAGPEASYRLGSPLNWSEAAPPAPTVRIDGWIDPPSYTRLPPIMLTFAGPDAATGEAIRAPHGSTIIVRISGAPDAAIEASSGLQPLPVPAGVRQGIERRFMLSASGSVRLGGAGVPASAVPIAMVPDKAPTIALTETPQAGQRGQLTVVYRARDDYGIASVEAGFRPVTATARPGARPLIDPPRTVLPNPGETSGEADIKTTLELAEHPWAGARVTMTLTARDDAGQEGSSEAREVTLPQRAFNKPLARALVEVRRWLVLDVTDRPRVQTALDALLIEPGEFTKEVGAYLSLKIITEKLRSARGDPRLLEVVDDLWQLALLLEDGDLSDAERQLRAAQDRLQQAMERGADPEELSRLTQELREAMNRYMRELAEQMQRDQQNGRQNEMSQLPENFRTVTPRDLNNMLNRIDELNKRGETEEAQRLLNELNNMMRNLQQARPGQMDPRQREMQNQLSELDRMTREQQDLRDETFQDGQEQRGQQRNQRANPNQRGQQQARPNQGQRQPGQRGQQGQPQDGQEGQEGQEGQQGQQGQQGRDQLAQRQQQL
nr:TIGR02302 family protein [Beijerinckiaceae bacterium]